MSLFSKIHDGVAKVWRSIVPELKKDGELALEIVNKIKAGANYAGLTDGLSPDAAAKVNKYLNETVVTAGIVKNYVDGMDENSIINSVRNSIDTATANGDIHRNILLNDLGLLATHVFSDGKFGWDDLIYVPKFLFTLFKKKQAA